MYKTISTPEILIYSGYPNQRLVADKKYLLDCEYTIPEGPWSVALNADAPLPNDEEKARFLSQGLRLDKMGRPLHPMLEDLIFDHDLGIVTGKGYFYNWGPNNTADAVVVYEGNDEPEVALIKRGDTGKWAFIGGFIDGDETFTEAASREAYEETNGKLILDPNRSKGVIYAGIQTLDPRSTAHAWIYTEAVLWESPDRPELDHGDDAKGARWQKISSLQEVISPSHLSMARKLLEFYNY